MGVRFLPFRKAKGGVQFAGYDGADDGGGGGSYVLPVATSEKLGGIKIGTGVNISVDGTISVDTNNLIKKEYVLNLSNTVNWYTVDNTLKDVDYVIASMLITNNTTQVVTIFPNGYNDGETVVNAYVASDTGLSFYGKVTYPDSVTTKLIIFYKESEVET